MDWKTVPKTELHIHLEGAAPVDFILEKAREKKMDLSNVVGDGRYIWTDFNDFLNVYEQVMTVLTTPQDFADLTRAVLNAQANHGVVYTELTLGVWLMAENDPARWREMLFAIDEACDEMEAARGIVARHTAVIVRHFGVEKAEATARLVAASRSPRVTGFGMAGAEDFGRPTDFKRAYEVAREADLGLTVHAGEWCAADAIEESISALGVTRIGHGVRAVESESTIAMIKDRDIHLEVNPGSNVALGASNSWRDHQIHGLKDAGVSLSISTDDPPYFDTTMTREYEELATLGWTENDFKITNREALRHAFLDDDTREKLIGRF